jgi:hypothetical protein
VQDKRLDRFGQVERTDKTEIPRGLNYKMKHVQYDVEYDSLFRHYARYIMKRVMNWQELRNQSQCEDIRNWRIFRHSIRTKSMLLEEETDGRRRNRSVLFNDSVNCQGYIAPVVNG